MKSFRFSLNATDWVKIGMGALIATAGALAAFIADVALPQVDISDYTGVALAGVLTVVVNLLRKFAAGPVAPQPEVK